MKKQLFWILFLLSLIISFPLCSQDPDAWEARQTAFQPPEKVIEAIGLTEGMIVGEIGAGQGRYSVILAEKVGDKGHIYANDIDQEALDYLDLRCRRDNISNISTLRGKMKDPMLPANTLDMIFIVNSYHHFTYPVDVLKNAYPALKKGATLAIIEGVPGRYGRMSSHATPSETLIKQVEEAGYTFFKVAAELQRDNIYIFRK